MHKYLFEGWKNWSLSVLIDQLQSSIYDNIFLKDQLEQPWMKKILDLIEATEWKTHNTYGINFQSDTLKSCMLAQCQQWT